jgi:hypothetical protein
VRESPLIKHPLQNNLASMLKDAMNTLVKKIQLALKNIIGLDAFINKE